MACGTASASCSTASPQTNAPTTSEPPDMLTHSENALVMAKPKFLLQLLIIAFDPPAQLGDIDQTVERNVLGQGREPVFGRLRLILRPFDQEPFFSARLGEAFIAMGSAHPQPREARLQPIGRPL